ncbi:aKG-HExxH-type peptide beta-hydroxylase [Frankia sp. Cr2]|uniref:aKG-HExxH-type peptide beta-hydroxylase n=1 Tax=Frankia sp. Cr2 TaxID=3073932 RepID=UPI002AD3059F|nr:HEXXH motif-containing putative peptide modification protein [Frankia sp. Cr2]
MNQNLVFDLSRHIEVAEKVLPGTARRAGARLIELDPTRRINPEIFTCYFQIADGIRQQDAGRVASGLGGLTGLINSAPYAEHFSVGPLRYDRTEAEILDFLCGPEGPRSQRGEFPEMWVPNDDDVAAGQKWVTESLLVLGDLDSDLAAEFGELAAELRLFRGRAARGITSVRSFGLILLRLPDRGQESSEPLLYFLDHIAHETSHMVLHTLMNIEPLVIGGHDVRYSAPIRPDHRPLYGIYHATFVLSRITRLLARLAAHDPRPPVLSALQIQYERFGKGIATLAAHATLTATGRKVLESCERLVESELVGSAGAAVR